MQITLNIDDRLISKVGRLFSRRGAAIALSLVVLITGVSFARAATVTVPFPSFQPNTPIRSSEVNANFAALADAASMYTNPDTSQQYSLRGGVCGQTAPINGNMNGYSGAANLCAAVTGCSAGAHMCTSMEMVRWATTGGTFTGNNGWIATGAGALDEAGGAAGQVRDCGGFTSTTFRGVVWSNPSNGPSITDCNNSLPILCCN